MEDDSDVAFFKIFYKEYLSEVIYQVRNIVLFSVELRYLTFKAVLTLFSKIKPLADEAIKLRHVHIQYNFDLKL